MWNEVHVRCEVCETRHIVVPPERGYFSAPDAQPALIEPVEIGHGPDLIPERLVDADIYGTRS